MNLQTEKTRVTLNNKQKSKKKLPKGLKLPASAASANLARDEQGCVGGIVVVRLFIGTQKQISGPPLCPNDGCFCHHASSAGSGRPWRGVLVPGRFLSQLLPQHMTVASFSCLLLWLRLQDAWAHIRNTPGPYAFQWTQTMPTGTALLPPRT